MYAKLILRESFNTIKVGFGTTVKAMLYKAQKFYKGMYLWREVKTIFPT